MYHRKIKAADPRTGNKKFKNTMPQLNAAKDRTTKIIIVGRQIQIGTIKQTTLPIGTVICVQLKMANGFNIKEVKNAHKMDSFHNE